MVFYEKYSEKVFNDIMTDLIMKSKDKNEEEAKIYFDELTAELTINDTVCVTGFGNSIRQGIIYTLMNNEVNFNDFFKENINNHYDLSTLSVNLFKSNDKYKFIISDLDCDTIAWGYEKDMITAFLDAHYILVE